MFQKQVWQSSVLVNLTKSELHGEHFEGKIQIFSNHLFLENLWTAAPVTNIASLSVRTYHQRHCNRREKTFIFAPRKD